MNWFLHCVANLLNWLLSRPFDQIFFAFCSKLTPFKTILLNFCILYPVDSFQDYLVWFLHCVQKLLLSRSYGPILSLCIQLTPFQTIWPNFVIVYTIDSFQDHLMWCLYCVLKSLISNHMTSFKTFQPCFCIVYPIDSFQAHLTQFYHSESNWLLSRPFDLILSLCTQFTQLTPFKTIWPNFIIVYPIASFQDHLT